VRAGLGSPAPTLTLVFASPQICRDAETMLAVIHERLAPQTLLGCMGETIIAAGREVEEGPALAVWAAHLPGAEIVPFRLQAHELQDRFAFTGWPGAEEDEEGPPPHGPILLLADPFTFPADHLLAALNVQGLPIQVIGGLASGGRRPGEHRLFAGTQVLMEGAVGATLAGVEVLPVVSQGCEPIGPDMVITAGEGSKVEGLAGQPAVTKLEEVLEALDPRERSLAGQGLLAGLVIDENKPDYERGDYLIRGIHGGDRASGALFVGERVRVGQTMRFHVRDAASADEDLRAALRRAREALGGERPAGGLIFSCNGRGVGMFGAPDHDAQAVGEELGDPPLAGFFCNGEIGPVGGKNFLHGFTATMAVFAAPDAD
jgi:small ligand-binding sensory domain FIST